MCFYDKRTYLLMHACMHNRESTTRYTAESLKLAQFGGKSAELATMAFYSACTSCTLCTVANLMRRRSRRDMSQCYFRSSTYRLQFANRWEGV